MASARFSAFGSAVPFAAASTGGIGPARLVPFAGFVGSAGFARRSQGAAFRQFMIRLKTVNIIASNVPLYYLLDISELFDLIGTNQGVGFAGRSGPPGARDTMYVILVHIR